jgi:hypothetical protein
LYQALPREWADIIRATNVIISSFFPPTDTCETISETHDLIYSSEQEFVALPYPSHILLSPHTTTGVGSINPALKMRDLRH